MARLVFFGIMDRLTTPFDPERGPAYIRDTLAILDGPNLSPNAREKIAHGHAGALVGLAPSG